MFFKSLFKSEMISAENSLPGRSEAINISGRHTVLGSAMQPPYPADSEQLIIGMGCFWGVERIFWKLPGVITSAVGYSAGFTPNPTYEEVCSGKTGHNEVVLIVFDPAILSLKQLLKTFWESHNPTQGMRQGNDSGTQYRSGLYFFNEQQKQVCEQTKEIFDAALKDEYASKAPAITTEIKPASAFYFAEEYHQQYLDKNPNGYCGLGGMGISCAV
jgi:peptide-methionine (S)-S-oxide reductase